MDEEKWLRTATNGDARVRRIAALSNAERSIEIRKVQVTDKDTEVREAVFDTEGRKVVLFRGEGEDEWSYFTKKGQGKVSLIGREPKMVEATETKEGVLLIGDKGKVIALGKPGKTETLPDIRASYPRRASKAKTERVGTLLTREGRFNNKRRKV